MAFFGNKKSKKKSSEDHSSDRELWSEAENLAKAIHGRLCSIVLDRSQTVSSSTLPIMTWSCQAFDYPRGGGEHPHQITLATTRIRLEISVSGGVFERMSFSSTLDPTAPHDRSVLKSQNENQKSELNGEAGGEVEIASSASTSSLPSASGRIKASAKGKAATARSKTTHAESNWTESNSRFSTYHVDNSSVEITAKILDGETHLDGKIFDDVLSKVLFDDDVTEMELRAKPNIHHRDLVTSNQTGVFNPSPSKNHEMVSRIIATKLTQHSLIETKVLIPRPDDNYLGRKK